MSTTTATNSPEPRCRSTPATRTERSSSLPQRVLCSVPTSPQRQRRRFVPTACGPNSVRPNSLRRPYADLPVCLGRQSPNPSECGDAASCPTLHDGVPLRTPAVGAGGESEFPSHFVPGALSALRSGPCRNRSPVRSLGGEAGHERRVIDVPRLDWSESLLFPNLRCEEAAPAKKASAADEGRWRC